MIKPNNADFEKKFEVTVIEGNSDGFTVDLCMNGSQKKNLRKTKC
jgi:hypothetical protein